MAAAASRCPASRAAAPAQLGNAGLQLAQAGLVFHQLQAGLQRPRQQGGAAVAKV
jgi:hypothetical protein